MKQSVQRKYILLLTIFFIVQFLIVTRFGTYIYGSTLDWDSQHYMIPDYFRKLFYETGEFFPDFAPNLGAGQNIYNLSYYGLFSPVIMLSYLLPFVPMKLYIQITTVLLVYISVILLYRWLLGHFTHKSSAMAAMIFILAAPLLFHTHRHIMFVSYMPFLIMGLMGVDEYFEKGRKWLISLSVLLICLTSWFFAIGSVAAIVIYGIYIYISKMDKVTVKGFFADGFRFLAPVFLGILMSAFLLIPTFVALLGGRGDSGTTVDILSLFIPTLDTEYILYDTYSPGLTSFIYFCLIYCVVKLKRENRFLGIVLSAIIIFPVFIFLMCGGMYINAKVLIPFLPLYMLAAAAAIRDIFSRRKAEWSCIALFAVLAAVLTAANIGDWLLMVDLVLTLAAIIIFNIFRKRRIIVTAVALVLLVSFFSAAFTDTLVEPVFEEKREAAEELIEAAVQAEDGIYRINDRTGGLDIANRIVNGGHYVSSIYSSVSDGDYQRFYYDGIGNEIRNRSRGQLSNTFNAVFNLYMGNKYIVGEVLDELGYETVAEQDGKYLYRNENALPIGYATERVMSYEQFESLSYPYNAEALLNYVIVEDAPVCEYETTIEEITLDYDVAEQCGVTVSETEEYINVHSDGGGEIVLNLKNDLDGKMLFISFEMLEANPSSVGDSHISINGNVNKLSYSGWKYNNGNYSFEYTLSDKIMDSLHINFRKGNYRIADLKVYAADYESFVSKTDEVSPLNFHLEKTKGDIMEGTVTAASDGYFNMSVPYDEGFAIYVDGEKTEYEMTDTAFIGFKLNEGEHHIKIEYHAPAASVSKCISAAATVVFALATYFEVKKKKNGSVS